MRQKISNWKNQSLSTANREILIKAVLQAILVYTMSLYQLLKSLCVETTSLIAKFWWGFDEQNHKIHWLNWKKMGAAKMCGGLGCRDLEHCNRAMLAKQVWTLLTRPHSLIAMIMKENHFKLEDILKVRTKSDSLFMWQSIIGARELVLQGLRWRVGNGTRIKLWQDKWLNTPSFQVQTPNIHLHRDAIVKELIVEE